MLKYEEQTFFTAARDPLIPGRSEPSSHVSYSKILDLASEMETLEIFSGPVLV